MAQRTTKKNGTINPNLIVGSLLIIVLAIAAYLYYDNRSQQTPPPDFTSPTGELTAPPLPIDLTVPGE